MNIKDYVKKHHDGTLPDEEWEHLAKDLLEAKFDREKKSKWTQQLREMGVYRTPASSLTVRSVRIRKYLAAASITLVMAAAGWYFFLKNPLSSAQQMASQYLEQPFRLNTDTRGENATEQNRGKAHVAFEMKKYEESLSYLTSIEAEGQANAYDFFQMGLCMMYKKDPDYIRAVNAFNAAQKIDQTIYYDEINWFSGLCYLMQNNQSAAITSLKKVADSPSSRNRDAAIVLLRQMER